MNPTEIPGLAAFCERVTESEQALFVRIRQGAKRSQADVVCSEIPCLERDPGELEDDITERIEGLLVGTDTLWIEAAASLKAAAVDTVVIAAAASTPAGGGTDAVLAQQLVVMARNADRRADRASRQLERSQRASTDLLETLWEEKLEHTKTRFEAIRADVDPDGPRAEKWRTLQTAIGGLVTALQPALPLLAAKVLGLPPPRMLPPAAARPALEDGAGDAQAGAEAPPAGDDAAPTPAEVVEAIRSLRVTLVELADIDPDTVVDETLNALLAIAERHPRAVTMERATRLMPLMQLLGGGDADA